MNYLCIKKFTKQKQSKYIKLSSELEISGNHINTLSWTLSLESIEKQKKYLWFSYLNFSASTSTGSVTSINHWCFCHVVSLWCAMPLINKFNKTGTCCTNSCASKNNLINLNVIYGGIFLPPLIRLRRHVCMIIQHN